MTGSVFHSKLICRSCLDIIMFSLLSTKKMTGKAIELKSFPIRDRIPKWKYQIVVSATSLRERNRLFVRDRLFIRDRIPKWKYQIVVSATSLRERNRLFVLQPFSPLKW